MSSATDSTVPTTNPAAISEVASKRPNPVALETMVNVTGARQTVGGGSRDLFSEDTTTVLVFRDGAVIRLDAGVAIGQLLFVKHKKSGCEVVCQVLHKRAYRPTTSYVELLFTEDKPDFWGVAFPEMKAGGTEFRLKEQLEAEETSADDQGGVVAPRSEAEVDKLRKELEDLRQQLKNLEKEKTAEAAHAQKHDFAQPDADSSPQQPAQNAAPAVASPNLSAQAQAAPPAVRPMVGMALPTQTKSSGQSALGPTGSADPLLPQPELDFSRMPAVSQAAGHQAGKSQARLGRKELVIVGLSALALVTVAMAWWRHSHTATTSPTQPASVAADVLGSSTTTAKQPAPNSQPATPATTQQRQPSFSSAETPAGKFNAVPFAGGASASHSNPTTSNSDRRTRSTAKHPATPTPSHTIPQNDATTGASASASADVTSTPAKLLKAANPVYPPDAMRHYITGDVRASAVVDASGHVQNVEVLAGPQALRAAAIEALKHYQYAPATQAGKPVSSTVVVTVKFWFNP